MSDANHTPVLLDEVIAYLDPKPGQWIVDCTLNGGGHAAAIVATGARVLGIEWDPTIAAAFPERHPELVGIVTVVNDTYTNLERICADHGVAPDGILFDLGLSSLHYETSGRGFSFLRDEPLDMRFNPETNPVTASRIVNEWPIEELERILTEYGEEQFAGQIAAAVALARRTAPLRTTTDLVQCIESAVPAWYRHRKLHCATKTFQALRVAVNAELENVEQGVAAALRVLKPGGRLLVISFQGAEDKIVRELFKTAAKNGTARWVTRSTVRPSWGEVSTNPRSRSAKLKIIERL
ncbi:MAG: 16S rRNA (cytosine(1402)-N(4))-methyltransferase RsmH [Candidatus Yanofskybacteria bacterium]|nr:16S rRNA (cytosine(1402)-N(4))-methyltransferase RsmH [Candidatus Yanofskybacteria bacterium]